MTATVAQWGREAAELAGGGATLKQVCVKAGHAAPRHSHPFEQFVLIVSGAGKLECEAGEVDLRPGTVLLFAPDAWHSATFHEATVLVEVNFQPRTEAR